MQENIAKNSKTKKIVIGIIIVLVGMMLLTPILFIGGGALLFYGVSNEIVEEYEGTEQEQQEGRDAIAEYLENNYKGKYSIEKYELVNRKSVLNRTNILYAADTMVDNKKCKFYVALDDNYKIYTDLGYEEKIKELTDIFIETTGAPLPQENLSEIYIENGYDINALPCGANTFEDIVKDKNVAIYLNFVYQTNDEINPRNLNLHSFYEKIPDAFVEIINMVEGYEDNSLVKTQKENNTFKVSDFDFVTLIKDKISAQYNGDGLIEVDYEHYAHENIMNGKVTLIYNDHVLSNEIIENEGEMPLIHEFDGKTFEQVDNYYLLKTSVVYDGQGLDEDLYQIIDEIGLDNGMTLSVREKNISMVNVDIDKEQFENEYLYLSNYGGQVDEIKELDGDFTRYIRIETSGIKDGTQETIIGFYKLIENIEETSSEISDEVSSMLKR